MKMKLLPVLHSVGTSRHINHMIVFKTSRNVGGPLFGSFGNILKKIHDISNNI